MNEVKVLLSSYNGHNYIREQLDSIFAQKGVDVSVLVRDDGSTDDTVEILEEYKSKFPLDYYQGGNIGPARSFLQLLRDAPVAEYYAFADEDDYWPPEKLYEASNAIEPYENGPALYCCATQLADKNLSALPSAKINPRLTFGEALVYRFISGCTMVVNENMRSVINKYSPSYLPMHDMWIYCVAQAIHAKIFYDPTPHILYRQHGDNTVGLGHSSIYEWRLRFKRLINKEHLRFKMASEIKEGYGDMMPPSNLDTLFTFIDAKKSFLKRLRLIRDKRFCCSDKKTYRLFKYSVLLNTY